MDDNEVTRALSRRFYLITECGRRLLVNLEWYGKTFDGDTMYVFERGDKQVTFTLKDTVIGYRALSLTGIIGEIDVDGEFGAYLTWFSRRREGLDYLFEYRLKGGIERSVYDYLVEVGV